MSSIWGNSRELNEKQNIVCYKNHMKNLLIVVYNTSQGPHIKRHQQQLIQLKIGTF